MKYFIIFSDKPKHCLWYVRRKLSCSVDRLTHKGRAELAMGSVRYLLISAMKIAPPRGWTLTLQPRRWLSQSEVFTALRPFYQQVRLERNLAIFPPEKTCFIDSTGLAMPAM